MAITRQWLSKHVSAAVNQHDNRRNVESDVP
jgi:hypothetical protein